jgi:RNA polymerase sigma-70 factor (ECF subfamily)
MPGMTQRRTAPGQPEAVDEGSPDRPALEAHLAGLRGELTGYCYRVLGSPFEADDAAQETMIRAWRALDRFEGRSSLRTWLYRIATNVCNDLAASRARQARPIDLTGPGAPAGPPAAPLPETTWVLPAPDPVVLGVPGPQDPAELAVARESVRLALVVALRRLAPRQRAVLILREVLGWSAAETAELLDTSVAAVNSALQRARAAVAAADAAEPEPIRGDDAGQRELLARYVMAFERYDMTALTALLHADATMSMPPPGRRLRGPAGHAACVLGPASGREGPRSVPARVTGQPAPLAEAGSRRPEGGRHGRRAGWEGRRRPVRPAIGGADDR